MSEINNQSRGFRVSVNPDNMAQRLVFFDDEDRARAALEQIQKVMLTDKAFKEAGLSPINNEIQLVVETTEPGHWLSPGIESDNSERQSSLFRQLGQAGLA
jgi:hypothetical protein